jgi:hypothetical protein
MFLSRASRHQAVAIVLILTYIFSNLFSIASFAHAEDEFSVVHSTQLIETSNTDLEFSKTTARLTVSPYREIGDISNIEIEPNSQSNQISTDTSENTAKPLKSAALAQAASPRLIPVKKQPIALTNPNPTDPKLTQLQKEGKWSNPKSMSVVGIQASTLPNGKILLYDGSEGVGAGDERTLDYTIYDTASQTFNNSSAITPQGQILKYAAFCAAMFILPNGNLFIAGGDVAGDAVGTKKSGLFDVANNTWNLLKNMAFARWYPSAIQTLAGEILVAGGTQESYQTPATTPELYNIATNTWRSLIGADDTNDDAYGGAGHFYPWLYNLSNGSVANLGPRPIVSIINPEGNGSLRNYASRDLYDADTILSSRMQIYGSVARFSKNEILFTGGGGDESAVDKSKLTPGSTDIFGTTPVETANILRLDELLKTNPGPNGADPIFTQQTDSPQNPRANATLVIMADGKVMLTGGSSKNEGADRNSQYDNAILTPEVWDKNTGKWTNLAPHQSKRIYHSIALLQKDGTIFQSGGSGFNGQCVNDRAGNNILVKGPNACKQYEIYQPGYLFDGNGNLKPRPTITSFAPMNLAPGSNFAVNSDKEIAKVTFVKAGNTTHATNTQQYFMNANVQTNGNVANITLPATYFDAPKGSYFMFVWNSVGTLSIAQEITIN